MSNAQDAQRGKASNKQASESPRRSANMDHISREAGKLAVVGGTGSDTNRENDLVFWTSHTTKRHLVNLTEFAEGKMNADIDCDEQYTGRRSLIEQLAPAFRARHAMAAPRTIESVKSGLRKWWRLFDAMEAEERASLSEDATVCILTSVYGLGPLHGDKAVQSGMNRDTFHSFVVLADITRLSTAKAIDYCLRRDGRRSRASWMTACCRRTTAGQ